VTAAHVTRPPAHPAPLPWLEVALESVVGDRLGAGVYRRWVEALSLAGDERVLEIGAGAGACARHLAAAVPRGRLTCVEIDPRWLAIARRRLTACGDRVEFVEADACDWSRPGGFDVAILHFVLHDVPAVRRPMLLRGIARSLCPGGRLCVREPVGHGMSAEAMRAELGDAGFHPTGDEVRATVPLMGRTLSGAWHVPR